MSDEIKIVVVKKNSVAVRAETLAPGTVYKTKYGDINLKANNGVACLTSTNRTHCYHNINLSDATEIIGRLVGITVEEL